MTRSQYSIANGGPGPRSSFSNRARALAPIPLIFTLSPSASFSSDDPSALRTTSRRPRLPRPPLRHRPRASARYANPWRPVTPCTWSGKSRRSGSRSGVMGGRPCGARPGAAV